MRGSAAPSPQGAFLLCKHTSQAAPQPLPQVSQGKGPPPSPPSDSPAGRVDPRLKVRASPPAPFQMQIGGRALCARRSSVGGGRDGGGDGAACLSGPGGREGAREERPLLAWCSPTKPPTQIASRQLMFGVGLCVCARMPTTAFLRTEVLTS